MATAVANSQDLPYSKPVALSLMLHLALAGTVVVSAYLHLRGDQWAGVGGTIGQSINVTVVPSAGVPMPQPPAMDSPKFDPDNGMYNVAPQPKPPAPPLDAIPIPSPEKPKAKPQPQPPTPKKEKLFANKTPTPDNVVDYGKGGRLKNLVGDNSANPGANPSAGVSVPGQGGGDFATRFGWYIQAAKRRVDPNWDRLSIDPGVRSSTTLHCAVSFSINRDGSIKNVRITQSSGNLSWDNAGLRAIQGSNPLPPLPPDYQGSEVAVTWDFPEQHR
ncbi:MAG: TonB C-terminal domain-containing protein [Acidobacteria bacterium]|nr:TonB C-terminal domain-containing protein [Acidobacteriota bacterium]